MVNTIIKKITRILCRIDDQQLARIPAKGPLIMVANHINFLDIAVVYTHMFPRPMSGFAKAENWKHPILRPLFEHWNAIPIRRHEADLKALRLALAALKRGDIFGIAPEGTRSGHGQLQRGHPGVVTLALRSGAPLLPLAYYGGERFWRNIRSLRRTNFHIVVGHPFFLDPGEVKVKSDMRQQMIDEIMYQLAGLLPPAYRGVYSDIDSATETYLKFPPGSRSNLPSKRTIFSLGSMP